MKRCFVMVTVLCLLIMSVAATSVSAAPSGPGVVLADIYVNKGLGDYNLDGENLQVASDEATCTAASPASTTFLRWNVSAWAGETLESVVLTLTMDISGVSGLAQFTLYKVADDTWDETKMSFLGPLSAGHPEYTSPPAVNIVSDAIDVFTLPTGAYVGNIVFQSDNLKRYVDEEADGDGLASFALIMTSCPGDYAPSVEFLSKETGSETLASAASDALAAPDAITVPNMQILVTTAVKMTTFHAADPAVNWPLIAGVGALAAVLIGGLAVARRRAATH
jgi:hypothetical protein